MKWRNFLSIGLGVLYPLVLLLSYTPVKANNQIDQAAGEGFLHPYQGQKFYHTQGCHSDGWGNYVGGIPSTCGVDFTAYADSRDTSCGAPAMAPVSGNFSYLGTDKNGSTMGVLDGTQYIVFLLHGDFVPDGYLKQGDIIGYEGDHGWSTACHWHLTVFDKVLNQWVNPNTLKSVGVPAGAGSVVTLDIAKLKVELKNTTVVVEDGYLDGLLFSVTPTAAIPSSPATPPELQPASLPEAKIPGTISIEIGQPLADTPSVWQIDLSKLPINWELLSAKVDEHKNLITFLAVALIVIFLISTTQRKDG